MHLALALASRGLANRVCSLVVSLPDPDEGASPTPNTALRFFFIFLASSLMDIAKFAGCGDSPFTESAQIDAPGALGWPKHRLGVGVKIWPVSGAVYKRGCARQPELPAMAHISERTSAHVGALDLEALRIGSACHRSTTPIDNTDRQHFSAELHGREPFYHMGRCT